MDNEELDQNEQQSDSQEDNGNLLVYQCKYLVQDLIFIYKDEKIEMDQSNIMAIEKLDDYEFNIRSLLKITLRMDLRKKMWILKHKREIICKFELDCIGMDTDLEEYITNQEEIWNLEFSIYLSDEDESIDVKLFEERLKNNEEESTTTDEIDKENYFDNQYTVDIYLFNKENLDASNKPYNTVYTKDTMQQFIARLLTETKHEKVLMSKIENDEVYTELLIPPNKAYKCLIYLDQYYGFYETGALIYYDLDMLYILNTNGKLTAKQEDEWPETTFAVTEFENSIPGDSMVRVKDEKVFYVAINEMSINPQRFTDTNNERLGSEAKIVVSDDTTIDIEKANQSYVDTRNEFIKFIKKDDNKYTKSIIKARMEENECIMYINGENFDIRAFTPNKTYQIIFGETSKQERYGKYKYRIAYAYHYIKIESTKHMSSSHRIVLKKCKSDDYESIESES